MGPADTVRPPCVTEMHLRQMLCNSMSVNVLERILCRCLCSLGIMARPFSHWDDADTAREHVSSFLVGGCALPVALPRARRGA